MAPRKLDHFLKTKNNNKNQRGYGKLNLYLRLILKDHFFGVSRTILPENVTKFNLKKAVINMQSKDFGE